MSAATNVTGIYCGLIVPLKNSYNTESDSVAVFEASLKASNQTMYMSS